MRTELSFRNISGMFLAFVFLTCAGFAQTRIEIKGEVTDENRAAIGGASVVVKDSVGNAVGTASTDETGRFSFSFVEAGTYLVEVSASGFAAERVRADGTSPVVIVLRPANVAAIVSVSSSYLAGSADALERTSGSIQSIDRETLEKARVADFSEALRKIPGVVARDEEGFGLRPNVGIRGTNPTRSTKVLLLEDGVPLAYAPYGDNASYYHPPIERFESIEVQKGSGQIAFGPVTVAGLVNYITPNPPERPTLSLKLTGGNRDLFNGNAQFGGTFAKTGLIVNANRKQGAGSRANVRTGLTDVSSKIVRTFGSRNVLTGKFSIFAEDSRVTYSGLTESEFRVDPRANPFLNDEFSGRRIGFSIQHAVVLSSRAELATVFYTNRFSRDWWRQSSNSAQRPNRLNLDPDCRSMADLNTTCGNEGRLRDYLNWGIEPKLTARFAFAGLRNEIAAGFRYTRESQYRLQLNGDAPRSRDGFVAEDNLRRNGAASGFVQNRFLLGELAVSVGVRIEQIDYYRLNRLNLSSGRSSIAEIIPGLGLAYNIFGNTTIFAGLHRGFAPPRTEDVISNNGGIVEIDAESSWNFEAGFRSKPHDAISFEATFFRTDYRNQVVPASIAGGVGSAFTNGGRTLHQGVEFSGRFDSAKVLRSELNLYFQSGVTLLADARFRGTRFSMIGGAAGVSVSGNRIPYAPRISSNSIAGIAFRSFDGFVESNFIGRQFSDDLNTVDPVPNGQRGAIQAQTYWNATANYRIEKLRSVIFFTVKNLFDRTFVVDRSRGILPSAPRLVQTGIRIDF